MKIKYKIIVGVKINADDIMFYGFNKSADAQKFCFKLEAMGCDWIISVNSNGKSKKKGKKK